MSYSQQRSGTNQDRPNFKAMTDYYDANGRLRKEVFIDWPKTVASKIGVSRTNMRRAYDFVAAMRFRILAKKEDPAKIVQEGMGQLHRFVEYQAGREHSWQTANNFFQAHCNAVGNDPKKFEGFYQLFQSVMAYLRR